MQRSFAHVARKINDVHQIKVPGAIYYAKPFLMHINDFLLHTS